MPPSGGGHKPIIAATHQVIYDLAAGVYGDDTSSTTVANNGVCFSTDWANRANLVYTT